MAGAEPCRWSPLGIRLTKGRPPHGLWGLAGWRDGLFEVQACCFVLAVSNFLLCYAACLPRVLLLTSHRSAMIRYTHGQDEGSQLVALASRAKPGDTVLDLCAGNGGKSLCASRLLVAPRPPSCASQSHLSPTD